MTKARRIALLIGVGAYSRLPVLRQPVADARAMSRILEQNGEFQCTVVENPDFVSMRHAIIEHLGDLKPPDTGLIFFSGHGVKHKSELFLCPVDMDPSRPNNQGLSGEEIRSRIGEPGGARAHIIMLDCCYAGAITKADPAAGQDSEPPRREMFDPGTGSGVVFFAATDPRSQAPAETKGAERATISPYTNLLLEGLGGAAGGDDRYVTAPALDRFLRRVSQERRLGLNPTYSANHLALDDIRLTLNPTPGWGRIPSHVREALDAPDAPTRIGAYYTLSLFAGASDSSQLADVAQRVLQDGLRREALQDGRVSEAIRAMISGLAAAAEHRAQQQRLTDAEGERAALRAEVDRLQADLGAAQRTGHEVRAELDAATSAAAQLRHLLDESQARQERLYREHDNAAKLGEQVEAARQEHQRLAAERDRLATRLDEAERGRQEAIAQAATLRGVADQNAAAAASMREGIKAAEQHLSDAVAEHGAAHDAFAAKLSGAENEVERLRRELADVAGLFQEAARTRTEMEIRAREAEQRLIEAHAARDAAVAQRNAARREGDKESRLLRDQLGMVEKALTQSRQELEAATSAEGTLRKELAAAARRRRKIKIRLGAAGTPSREPGNGASRWRIPGFVTLGGAAGALAVWVIYESFLLPEWIEPRISKSGYASGYSAGQASAAPQIERAQSEARQAMNLRDGAMRERDAVTARLAQAQPTPPQPGPPVVVRPPQPVLFDPKSDRNPINVTPLGRRWADDDQCKGFLTGSADSWWSRWQLALNDGTYHVWVYSDAAADERASNVVVDRFNKAFPFLKFDSLQDNRGIWGVIVAGGLTNLAEAQTICRFAQACLRTDSRAFSRGASGRQVCP
jgi:hypothetical protein